jgi:hypothetical protein
MRSPPASTRGLHSIADCIFDSGRPLFRSTNCRAQSPSAVLRAFLSSWIALGPSGSTRTRRGGGCTACAGQV